MRRFLRFLVYATIFGWGSSQQTTSIRKFGYGDQMKKNPPWRSTMTYHHYKSKHHPKWMKLTKHHTSMKSSKKKKWMQTTIKGKKSKDSWNPMMYKGKGKGGRVKGHSVYKGTGAYKGKGLHGNDGSPVLFNKLVYGIYPRKGKRQTPTPMTSPTQQPMLYPSPAPTLNQPTSFPTTHQPVALSPTSPPTEAPPTSNPTSQPREETEPPTLPPTETPVEAPTDAPIPVVAAQTCFTSNAELRAVAVIYLGGDYTDGDEEYPTQYPTSAPSTAIGKYGPIEDWCFEPELTDFSRIFYNLGRFNEDISGWDTSSVTNMSSMLGWTAFNQPLDSWDVSSVTDMRNMFVTAESFNQPLNSWDVGSVTNMSGMFDEAVSFNQPLDSWDVGSVTDMHLMFADALSFNQNLCAWGPKFVSDRVETESTNQTRRKVFSGSRCPNRDNPDFSLDPPGPFCHDCS